MHRIVWTDLIVNRTAVIAPLDILELVLKSQTTWPSTLLLQHSISTCHPPRGKLPMTCMEQGGLPSC